MTVKVKSLKPNKTVEIAVSPYTLVSDFKKLVEAKIEVPASEQRLLVGGKALLDSKLLYDYSLNEGATLHLMRKAGVKTEEKKEESPLAPLMNVVFWDDLKACLDKHLAGETSDKVHFLFVVTELGTHSHRSIRACQTV